MSSNHVPLEYLCPISQCLMNDPVVLDDGYSYDRLFIEEWLKTHDTSPFFGVIISKRIIPNRNLNGQIKLWKLEQEKSN